MNKKSILAVMLVASAWCCMFSMDFETRFEGVHWLREYYNEAIQKRNRVVIESHVPSFINKPWIDYDYHDAEVYWYEDMDVRSDSCYYRYSDWSKRYFVHFMNISLLVKSCDEIESDVYEIVFDGKEKILEEQYNDCLEYGCDWSALKDSIFDTFYFQFDGDYLYIYFADRNTLFATYCAYDEHEYGCLKEAVATNMFNMSDYTFPRHADGSCDYDENAWKSEKKSGIGTALRTGKATTTKENLCVYSDKKKTSPVLKTLAARTPVEILGVGGEETIDGIISNWVHVRLWHEIVDSNGIKIKWAMGGWCFGGVVSDMEEVSESANAPATEHAKSAETAVSKSAPAVGKTALVIENLRMRSDYNTTAEVVTTLATGTRVKILAPGREDTIDGITSNWVQVEVQDGAKDKDGNAIEAGTIGWFFGGYLSEAESAESDSPNEEASTAKEPSALPIVPIAASVVALAVLLAVVIFAVKKRKN